VSVQGTGKPKRPHFMADYEARTKRCPRCMKSKSFDEFYEHRSGDRMRVSSYCRACVNKQTSRRWAARRGGPPRRMPRFNAEGRAWCPNCRAYLATDEFRPHPGRPGKLWTYCKPCVREMDRMRYQWGDKRKRIESDKARYKRRQARRRQELVNRAEFVRTAIDTLMSRGFTRQDIAVVCKFGIGSMLNWQRGECIPHPSMERTVAEMLRMTAGYAPTQRRRPHSAAHPDRERLAAAMDAIWPSLGRKRRKSDAE